MRRKLYQFADTVTSAGWRQLRSPCRRCFSTKTTSTTESSSRPPTQQQRYTVAIARQVPTSFVNAVTKFADTSSTGGIGLSNAQDQLDRYLVALRRLVPTLCLPPLHDHADSVFVEDAVIAIGRRALMTNPGHPSRRGEVATIQRALEQLGFDDIVSMSSQNPSAFCDGGDVLVTGRHVFVGISERTNAEAVHVIRNVFPDETVISVPFDGQALHLKSIVTHIDMTTLLAPTGLLGDQVLQAMSANALGYDTIRLPSMLACNVMSVNGGILAQDTGCAESKELLTNAAKERGLKIEFLNFSEFAKCDGALTCCSVLLQI